MVLGVLVGGMGSNHFSPKLQPDVSASGWALTQLISFGCLKRLCLIFTCLILDGELDSGLPLFQVCVVTQGHRYVPGDQDK
jgi:hypothetical protein